MKYPRNVNVIDPDNDDWEPRPAVALERNGNLIYVERENGECDWVCPFEVEEQC